jgi:hypothetical protein
VTLWPASDGGSTGRVADALHAARDATTTRLGRRLAPMAVRYIVVVDRAAPSGKAASLGGIAPSVTAALAAQLDLKLLESDGHMLLYENAAWGPGRARLRPKDKPAAVNPGDIADATPVLVKERSRLEFAGTLKRGDRIHFSASASERWHLRVAGDKASHRRELVWANGYVVSKTGAATLSYSTPLFRRVVVVVELLLWVLAVRTLIAHARRRRRAAAEVAE